LLEIVLIMGDSEDLTVSTENAGLGLVYSGATYGWRLTRTYNEYK
jgi:hypothetical protein